MYFDYQDIRSDIAEAHRDFWQRLARPGSWWTGAERVAIAAASRDAVSCELCEARRSALMVNSVAGEHLDTANLHRVLPPEAIDAVHRIVTDQTRISAGYIDSNESQGLSRAAYVELVGITVVVLSIDEFHRAMSMPLEGLPEPVSGDVDRYMPENLSTDTGHVPMIANDGAVGVNADLWGPGGTANVVRALSLVPNAVRDWIAVSTAQYLSFEGMGNFTQPEGRAIDRMQIELVAGRVSAMNECFY